MSLLTTEEAVRLMFKVLQGFEETNTGKFYFEEWAIDDRIWTKKSDIPNTAPALNDGEVSGVVTRRVALALTPMPGNANAFYHQYLKDAISFKFGDGSYDWVLTDNNDQPIPKGQYRWLKSTNSRVLYFYDGAPANMPPKISFYQYTGSKDDFGSAIGNIPDANEKYRGVWDASIGSLPINGSGESGTIKKGDFWRVSANGSIENLIPQDDVQFGDVLYADVDDADDGTKFFVVQRNITIADYLLSDSSLLPQSQSQADALHNAVNPSDTNPLITASELAAAIYSLGSFAGDHDASGGLLPTVGTGNGGSIVKGDYWRISTGGTITGLTPEEDLTSGDTITARVDDADEVSEFFSTQGNADVVAKADKDFSAYDSAGDVVDTTSFLASAVGGGRKTALQIYNYLKTKFDSIYLAISNFKSANLTISTPLEESIAGDKINQKDVNKEFVSGINTINGKLNIIATKGVGLDANKPITGLTVGDVYVSNDTYKKFTATGTTTWDTGVGLINNQFITDGVIEQLYQYNGTKLISFTKFEFAASDEVSDLIVGTVYSQRRTSPLTIKNIFAGVTTAPTGSTIIIDIKKNGTSIFTTLLSIDASGYISNTAASQSVINGGVANFAIGDLLEVEITQIGSTIAGAGLKLETK